MPSETFRNDDGLMKWAAANMRAEKWVLAVQDLKCMVFSLIGAHFKIQPIQR